MSIASAGKENAERVFRQCKWDHRFMRVALEVATWSKDPGTHVGAVLVAGNKIIGTGYNGLPRAMEDRGLDERASKLSRTVHAEMNALFNSGGRGAAGATLYVTPLMCCDRCAVHLIQAGVSRVVLALPDAQPSPQLDEWKRAGALALCYFAEAGVAVDFLEAQA